MSKDKVLMIEPIGQKIIVDPYYPPSKTERIAQAAGIKTDIEITDKNRYWPEKRAEMNHKDFDQHPCQGKVMAIGMGLTHENNISDPEHDDEGSLNCLSETKLIGTLKVGDWIAFRVSSGEELVYNGIVYRLLAPHEILMKYLDHTER